MILPNLVEEVVYVQMEKIQADDKLLEKALLAL